MDDLAVFLELGSLAEVQRREMPTESYRSEILVSPFAARLSSVGWHARAAIDEALANGQFYERLAIIRAVRFSGSVRLARLVERRYRQMENEHLRQTALVTFVLIRKSLFFRAFIESLGDHSVVVRETAASRLALFYRSRNRFTARRVLLERASDPSEDPTVRVACVRSLSHFQGLVVDRFLASLLADAEGELRDEAVRQVSFRSR